MAATARAVPPDTRLTLPPGTERFLKTQFRVDSVVVDPPNLLHAEGLPANEVYVTVPPDAKGAGVLLAIGLDRIYAWDLCIGDAPCPASTSITNAKGACPDLAQITDDGKQYWSTTVKDDACLTALRESLAHAETPGEKLRFVMDERPAKTFVDRVTAAIAKDPLCQGLTTGYYGATLKLSGKASRAAIDRALLIAYRETAGRVSYDADQVTLTDPPPPPSGPPQVKEIPLSESLAAPRVQAAPEKTP